MRRVFWQLSLKCWGVSFFLSLWPRSTVYCAVPLVKSQLLNSSETFNKTVPHFIYMLISATNHLHRGFYLFASTMLGLFLYRALLPCQMDAITIMNPCLVLSNELWYNLKSVCFCTRSIHPQGKHLLIVTSIWTWEVHGFVCFTSKEIMLSPGPEDLLPLPAHLENQDWALKFSH